MTIKVIALNTFKEAVRDRMLYLLLFLRRRVHHLLPRPGPPHRRRPGQDHQRRRAGLHLAFRRPHGHPDRDGPRLQRNRKTDDLHPDLQAHPPPRVPPGQILRPGPDARGHARGDERHLPGSRLSSTPGRSSGLFLADRLYFHRARPGHGRRHPLLLFLDAHPQLALRPGFLSHRPFFLEPGNADQESPPARARRSSRSSIASSPTSRISTSRPKSSTACPFRGPRSSIAAAYGLVYTAFVLVLAVLIFRRRDFI